MVVRGIPSIYRYRRGISIPTQSTLPHWKISCLQFDTGIGATVTDPQTCQKTKKKIKNKTHHRTAHSFLLQRLRQYNKSPLFGTAVFSTSGTSSLYVYHALEPDLQPKKLCSSIPDVQRALRCPLMAIQRLNTTIPELQNTRFLRSKRRIRYRINPAC